MAAQVSADPWKNSNSRPGVIVAPCARAVFAPAALGRDGATVDASRTLPDRGNFSDEELVAILVEHGVPEHVAIERISNLKRELPIVIGREGDPIPIGEDKITVWLSAGSFREDDV